jgi:hypothetical protein
VPEPPGPANDAEPSAERSRRSGWHYRPWAELLLRCFSIDVLSCAGCGGRMRLLALVTDPKSARRFLRGIGEPTEDPVRAPARGPPYWSSRILRRAAGEVSLA